MAAADMVFPASPPPQGVDIENTNVLYLKYAEVVVMVAIFAMFLLHVLGSLRRQSSSSILHHLVMGVYTLSYPLLGYTIGKMQSSSELYFNDFTVWAVFLLVLLSGTDSLTACRLSDINNWKSIYVKQLYKGFLLVSVLFTFGYQMNSSETDSKKYMWLWIPLSLIVFIAILKSYVMIDSMRMVSKSNMGKNANVIAEYMKHKDNQLEPPFDPVTMEGYQYMVAGEKYCKKRPGSTPWYEKDDLKFITVEQIWRCKENLLTADRGKVVKDMCLSMALSKMLNRRFAGIKLTEAELPKTHDFVFKGLLVNGDKPQQRAFTVIEQELVFVHDIYYTRYSYLYQKGRYLALCLPVIMFAICMWLAVASLRVNQHDHNIIGSNEYRGMKKLTIFIMVALAFLEAYQLFLYIASGWFKVGLLRSYLTKPFLQRNYCIEKIIDLLLSLKAFGPWKQTLGQYCLLDKAMKERRKKSVKLSENVKKAIVDSVLGSDGHLTNGVTSLKKNGVHGHLSWACDGAATDGAATRTILIWHIATTLCKHHLEKEAKEPPQSLTVAYFKILKIAMARLKFSQGVVKTTPTDNTTTQAVETASVLSNYCMHLLAFKPNLLPDHSSISESILDDAIEEAGNLLKEAKNNKMETRYEILMNISTHGCVGDEASLVTQGGKLAKHLIEEEPILRWKVLSDFWAEMMLYVSPSDDAQAHLELLATGGEFITHLWALLTHAGVLNRGPSGRNNVV